MSDPMVLGLLGLVLLFALIVLHVPVGVAMGMVGLLGTGILIGFDQALALLAIEPSAAMASEGLAIIAMFLLMGNLAHAGGLSGELYKLVDSFFGHRRGGLVYATITACAGFGAVCGSSVATAATMVRMSLPQMLRRGYAPSLAAGAIASGGTLGMIVPPSLVLVLYAILTETSTIALFLAAVVPGLLAVVFYFVATAIALRINPDAAPVGKRYSWPQRRANIKKSWAVLLLVLTVSGGIYSGVFTVPEAASVGASAALLLGLVRKRLTRSAFFASLSDTAANTGMIFVVIIGASVFSYFATLSGLPMAAVNWIEGLGLPPLLVLACLLALYLILGSIFDTIAAMVLTLPIVYPLVMNMGYDPYWWGVINVVVIELGMITPPFGINVFVLHGMAPELRLAQIYRGVLPFVLADLVRLTVLVLLPSLSLWLPRKLGWL